MKKLALSKKCHHQKVTDRVVTKIKGTESLRHLLFSSSTPENLIYVWNGADDTIHGRVEHRFGTRDLRTSSGGFQNRKQNYKITTTFE